MCVYASSENVCDELQDHNCVSTKLDNFLGFLFIIKRPSITLTKMVTPTIYGHLSESKCGCNGYICLDQLVGLWRSTETAILVTQSC